MGDHFQNVFLIEGPLAQSSVNVDLISGVTSGAQDVSGWGFGSVQIVASSGISSGAVSYEFGAVGQQISTGIAYALTGAMADADTTALASGDMKVALTYI